MKQSLYVPELGHDPGLHRIFRIIDDRVRRNNDDCLILNIGLTGSGKSTLSALQYKIVADLRQIEMDPEKIVITTFDFSERIAGLTSIDGAQRLIIYDEADASKREGMTRWNRDMIKLYSKIRGLNCVHIWNHPSLEFIDKPFIQERVNGVFFVYEKHKDKPRHYYFFTRKRMIDLLGKHKKLHLAVLQKYGPDFALYRGCFSRYDGPIMGRYVSIKAEGMTDAIQSFAASYGVEATKRKRGRPPKVRPDE